MWAGFYLFDFSYNNHEFSSIGPSGGQFDINMALCCYKVVVKEIGKLHASCLSVILNLLKSSYKKKKKNLLKSNHKTLNTEYSLYITIIMIFFVGI